MLCSIIVVWNVQQMAASLAVDSVNFVPLEAAFLARVHDLVGPNDGLREPDEQRDANDHRDDRC